MISNDVRMYSWSDIGSPPEIYLGKDHIKYIRSTIFSVVTSKGDLLYMFTDAN